MIVSITRACTSQDVLLALPQTVGLSGREFHANLSMNTLVGVPASAELRFNEMWSAYEDAEDEARATALSSKAYVFQYHNVLTSYTALVTALTMNATQG